MYNHIANGDDYRISLWLRVREFAVPPSMIETATVRRRVGDWAGACAAAGFDVDIDLRSLARTHGRELAARVRADLRCLAPDLLRWHMPRVAPDGLLRPGLTMTLARYHAGAGSVHLVVRTAPAWADAGQRISLALWDESGVGNSLHPHPRPNRRFRFDLHRHLWDARRTDELRMRSGAEQFDDHGTLDSAIRQMVPQGCAIDRWAAEAGILLRAEGRPDGPLLVRFGARRRVVAELRSLRDDPVLRIADRYPRARMPALPILPDAATWMLPDLALIRAGAITADRLHPLVASALLPDHPPPEIPCGTARTDQPLLVECRGEQHRIGLVNGVLTALDHDPAEIRREELLIALTGTPLPCLQAIDQAHRHPDCLVGVQDRSSHGDTAGALAIVEGLLGLDAALRPGALRDELEASARQRITYGLFRSGLTRSTPIPTARRRDCRSHPRNATSR
ncbi:hypothetical protein CRH09_24205 [Nocardia terpenica]|uniref:Uncharacterized protein n=2 Tax=Nocardia terpenica TaxID=455432 RepID=A0A291RXT0_9NOCA|nr:hypothetical protein [Nocardia terpenica]ATL72062.1 hypothetical protein CRH09_24205 [Nocardia terpenica]